MTQDTETQILVELRSLSERVDSSESQIIIELRGLNERVDSISERVDRAITENEKFSNRFNDYQQATQWVVQLSFGLIASATIITIIGTVFKR
jgi:hypothetical protein